MKVVCIGAGYVGGPTMVVMAKYNPSSQFDVVDLNEKRIAAWNSDKLPIFEPGLMEAVQSVRGVNCFFSTNLKAALEGADVIFLAVNTPCKDDGSGACDISWLELAVRSIAEYANKPFVLVEKSTVPVRTASYLRKVLEYNSTHKFEVLSNPEFLAEGTAIKDLERPDRVLIGHEDDGAGLMVLNELYIGERGDWVPRDRIISSSLWSAELAKVASNAFLAQRISSINSLSAICEKVDADVREIASIIGADSRIGDKFLQAGIGFGGSCFPKDVKALVYMARSLGLPEVGDYWEHVLHINVWQRSRVVENVVGDMFGSVSKKKVAVLGFAFKPNTADCRESPAADICAQFMSEGAHVYVYDPRASKVDMTAEIQNYGWEGDLVDFHVVESALEACHGAHAAVICTDWPEFSTLKWKSIYEDMIKPAYIYDGKNQLDLDEMRSIGFAYNCIGRAPSTEEGFGFMHRRTPSRKITPRTAKSPSIVKHLTN